MTKKINLKKVNRLFVFGLGFIWLALCVSSAWTQARKNPLTHMYEVYNSSSTSPARKHAAGRMIKKLEKAEALRAGTKSAPAVSAVSTDPALKLTNIDIFPNPVSANDKLTVRAQVGLADLVEIHIYDLLGRFSRIAKFTTPKIVNAGNGKGPQYTYEYIWDTSGAGTGLYICAVTAKKAGRTDLSSIKKIWVVKR
jgi:hypothetical protein